MLQALIFDVDGTLAETEELHRRAFNETFAHFGLDWHWSVDDYTWLLKTTGGKERMRAYGEHIGADISHESIAKIHLAKTNAYGELMKEGALSPRTGIVDLISRAKKAGLKIAVATTTNFPNVEALALGAFGKRVGELFDHIAAGDMVARKKPAPDVYELALRQLELPPQNCIAFEDTLNGVRAAKAAGLAVVLCQSSYSQGEEDGGAEFVLNSFEEATALPPLARALGSPQTA